MDAFLNAVGGEKIYLMVKDPLMRDVEAYGVLKDGQYGCD